MTDDTTERADFEQLETPPPMRALNRYYPDPVELALEPDDDVQDAIKAITDELEGTQSEVIEAYRHWYAQRFVLDAPYLFRGDTDE